MGRRSGTGLRRFGGGVRVQPGRDAMSLEPEPSAKRIERRVRYGRLIFGGIVVGAVVFGFGSRVAMRIVGLVASPEQVGEPTEFGAGGRVTLGGTAALVPCGAIGVLLPG